MEIWLDSIEREIEALDDEELDEVTFAECGPKDHVVGTLDKELRKLLVLTFQREMRTEDKLVEVTSAKESNEIRMLEVVMLKMETESLKHLFWLSCHHRFPELINKNSTAIRKGWKVVWTGDEEVDARTLLEGLFRDSPTVVVIRPVFTKDSDSDEEPDNKSIH